VGEVEQTLSASTQLLHEFFQIDPGVAILKYADGTVAYALAPEIAASVAATNIDNSVEVLDTSGFSIISRTQGYTIRQGAAGGVNALVAEKRLYW
jgi:hypothetical protein